MTLMVLYVRLHSNMYIASSAHSVAFLSLCIFTGLVTKMAVCTFIFGGCFFPVCVCVFFEAHNEIVALNQ